MSAIKEFVDFTKELVERVTGRSTVAIKEGRTYYKILRVNKRTNKMTGVFFFVEIETGEIYSPCSSRKPFLGFNFGNINEPDSYQYIANKLRLEAVNL